MIALGILLLIVLLLSGLPLFAGILMAALIGLLQTGIDPAAIAIEMTRMANAPILLAVPLFTLAGYLLSEGDTSARLVRLSKSLIGWLPGGLGVVSLLVSAFFTALTGATGITIIALGGLLFSALISSDYEENFSLGLLTISGSIGVHFPPSLPVILYGFVSGVNIEKLFLASAIPGILVMAIPALYCIWKGNKGPKGGGVFARGELFQALKGAAWEIPIPFFIVAAIYSGFSTATETAALTVVYVMIIKVFVYREIDLIRDMPRIMRESAKMVGSIMIILGASLGFTNFLVDSFIPAKILDAIETVTSGKIAFLVFLNVFLLLVGCIMDIFSAILIVVPLVVPAAERFGIEPLHLGVLFLTNLAIGYNTPPVGLNLFVASSRLKRPLVMLYKSTLPFLALLLLALIIISYIPSLSLFLPGIFANP
jgi:tripartite ATP-independent transporter DctM subunit